MTETPDRVSLRAPAKINLYLKITGRREDGYHYLATLMQKISLYDRLDIEKIPTGIRLRCHGIDLPEDESNLAFRAAKLFLEKIHAASNVNKSGVDITLQKKVPVAAGLGGGSSDAAAVLRGLDKLFPFAYTNEELMNMGASLGADVPFFVADLPAAWATGIGDRIKPAVPLDDYVILVVNPGYSVSTPWVYKNFALTVGKNINNLKSFQNPESDIDGQNAFLSRAIMPDELINDLEQVTSIHYPEIEQLKARLMEGGADAAMMSGSGPTVFGLFQMGKKEKAAVCADELKSQYQNTFLVDPVQI